MPQSAISPTSEVPEPIMKKNSKLVSPSSETSELVIQNLDSPASSIAKLNEKGQLRQASVSSNGVDSLQDEINVTDKQKGESSQLDSSALLAKDGCYLGFFVKSPSPPNRRLPSHLKLRTSLSN